MPKLGKRKLFHLIQKLVSLAIKHVNHLTGRKLDTMGLADCPEPSSAQFAAFSFPRACTGPVCAARVDSR
jgi:hypothetical protein